LLDLQPRHLHHDESEVHVQVGTSLEEAERLLVLRTFAFAHGDHKRAATMLGLTLKDLKAKLQQYAK
jgi:DNA-binding NtrC family response regulator